MRRTTYRVAHAVKGAMSAFGGEAARRSAEALELMSRRGSLDEAAAPTLDRLAAEIRDLIAVLDTAPWRD